MTEHELDEIRMLIEQRAGIWFDESRERFFSGRVREHMREHIRAELDAWNEEARVPLESIGRRGREVSS